MSGARSWPGRSGGWRGRPPRWSDSSTAGRPGRTLRNSCPATGRDERIAEYERHLHNLLTSTLHELERLQACREGEPVPPPAVADVNVTLNTGSG
jgi:hypothetical protein